MTTLRHWARLSAINLLANTTSTFNGVPYSLIVTGLVHIAAEIDESDCRITGNAELEDLYYILTIQLSASLGTLVTNNSVLCFEADLAWNQRNDSLLEYALAQVCISMIYIIESDCGSI